MTAESTYFALLITLAMIYDAGSAFARLERSMERHLTLPPWALQDRAKLVVTLAGCSDLSGLLGHLFTGSRSSDGT